jgi:hypothetical protein
MVGMAGKRPAFLHVTLRSPPCFTPIGKSDWELARIFGVIDEWNRPGRQPLQEVIFVEAINHVF